MSDKITITLNGQEVEVEGDQTIREVAESQGIHVPTFCHDNRLKPFASCFLCVVEVEKARTLLPACSTKINPGMVIHTDNEKVTRTRKMALDLLLSDHAGDCIAPCEATCPAHIDIQGYIAHIANGDAESAVRLIKKNNPLPVVCGRICPHPCESQCRRGLVDEAIAINPLKRFSSEYELENGPFMPECAPDSGKKVAIVGGGPAGLAAAYYLRQFGHGVEIFEALPELGGMVRYGIPRFRLPWDKLDNEINAILGLGVKVHHNQKLGRDFSIADLKGRGFNAVLLAIGAHKSKGMRVPNEDAPGVIGGIDFLRKVVMNEPVEVGEKVAVIGGGDTAMDCCRVARRMGAEVTLLYRRTQAEMPAADYEQHETIEEGVEFRFLTAPVEVVLDGAGKAKALRVLTMELGEPDESGRRRPVPIEGSEEDLPFDLIIPAIGQDPDVSCVDGEADKPETTRWKTFVYDEKNYATSVDGVFTAGDCAFGPDTVIRAVGEGGRAAQAIDLYLNGAKVVLTKPYAISRGRLQDLDMADFSPRYVHKKRALESTHPPEQRLTANGGWAAINVGLDRAQAMAEATRCIECGCVARFDCDLRNYSTEYKATEVTFAGSRRKYEVDARHPLVRLEPDKCITCASCVRICTEVRGIAALSFIQRGFVTKIGPNFNDPLQTTGCDACGMCIDVCPTGTMTANTGKEAGPWISDITTSSCNGCSRGCGVSVYVAEGRVVKTRAIDDDPVNGACICAQGRFGYQIRNSGTGDVADALSRGRAILGGAKGVAVVVSPHLPVEEAFVASRLAARYGGSLHYVGADAVIGAARNQGPMVGEANVALLSKLGATAWDGRAVDVLVLVGAHLSQVAGSGKVIAVGAHDAGVTADVVLQAADPQLETDGCYLNRDGDLAVIRRSLADPGERAGHRLLASLAGLDDLQELSAVRKALAAAVAEVTIGDVGKARLLKTALAPQLAAVAVDGRGVAFAAHLKKLGL